MEVTPVRIAGELVTTEPTWSVTNPFDGTVVGTLPECDVDAVDTACRAAAAALARDDFPAHRRAEVLDSAAARLRADREVFAARICAEAGKPITAARGEVDRCLDTLRFAAAEARGLVGEMVPMDASASGEGRLGFALRVPIGVVAAITPFNFPLNLVAHKVAPAIAAGCPVVLKPAPQAPLSAVAFVELLVAAGLPPDWVSVVTAPGPEIGQALVAHEVPRMVTFTGSTAVGWAIAAAAPRKKVALELGSNAPVIVEPDVDVAAVAAKIATGGYTYAGQSCISVQRVLVARQVADALRDALQEAVAALPVGDPTDERTVVGPMISPEHTQRVLSWIEDAAAAGAQVLTGGKVDDGVLLPTLVVDAPLDGDLWRQEAFGPVVVMRAYDTFDEAVALANDSDLGLHAGLFTSDVGRALEAARRLDFGGVVVNEVPTVRVDQQPYGGVRDAGNTREGPAYTVREMTELRFVSLAPPPRSPQR